MKAAYIEKTGSPQVILVGEQPAPTLRPSEILVRVSAVSVNPIDTYIRSGTVALPLEFPYIIGCDLAGVVEKCGTFVTRFKPGDKVWGSNQGLFGRQGSFAEYAAVDESWLYPIPENESFVEAAAGALVGITAHLGIFLHANLQPGEILFVNGGTGGVGSSVVQLAKAAQAKVIATVGSAEKKRTCEELGADLVIDYHSETMDDEIRNFTEANGGIDVWFETLREQTLERTIDLMAKRGRIVIMAGRNARPEFPVGQFYVKDLKLCGFAMFNADAEEQRAAADDMNNAFEKGDWKPCLGTILPFSEAAEAHRLQEDNTLQGAGTLSGKIVLEI